MNINLVEGFGMRTVRKILVWGWFPLAGVTALAYALDDLWARYQGRPVDLYRNISDSNRNRSRGWMVECPRIAPKRTQVTGSLRPGRAVTSHGYY